MTLEHAQHHPPLCPGRLPARAGRRGVLAPPAMSLELPLGHRYACTPGASCPVATTYSA
jgi:hypothetical protein